MSVATRVKRLEEQLGKGGYKILTHEGFIDGTGEVKLVSKEEYDEHMQQLKELA